MLKLAQVSPHPPPSGSPSPPSFEFEPVELLFALARRTHQAFSVIWLEILARPLDRFPDLGQLERKIAADLRRTDLLVRCDSSSGIGSSKRRPMTLSRRPADRLRHYVVFCPATDAQGAKELIRRIRSIASPRPLSGGVATFPLDALVLDDLIDLALLNARGEGEQGPPNEKTELEWIRMPRASRTGLDPRRRFAQRLKRAFDLVFSVLTASVWLPAIALVAFAIKCSDWRAPVMFPQMRTGRGGNRFQMYKFRTMVPNAEELKQKYAHLNELTWPDFKIENDPRVTRLGRVLRKTSLDELPQVLNVLRGEMSWVGPRPTSFGPETYEMWQTARLDVVPGVTGLWLVVGRGRTDMDERLRLDMNYIDRRSFWFDLKLLFLTVGEVLRPRGGF
jgi:lipopolysaccharide/colanic/teichoic acid biosynthesis glycosyltransferase